MVHLMSVILHMGYFDTRAKNEVFFNMTGLPWLMKPMGFPYDLIVGRIHSSCTSISPGLYLKNNENKQQRMKTYSTNN